MRLGTYALQRPRTHTTPAPNLVDLLFSSISMATVSDDNISFCPCHSHLGLRCHRSKRRFLGNKRRKEIRLGRPWICVTFVFCLVFQMRTTTRKLCLSSSRDRSTLQTKSLSDRLNIHGLKLPFPVAEQGPGVR